MSPLEIGFVVGCALFFGLLGGITFGVNVERRAWVMRALTRTNTGATPHYCDGRFFYVVEEGVFVNDYVRKRIVPPQGGSGTADPREMKPIRGA
jgi:hypothetical protein